MAPRIQLIVELDAYITQVAHRHNHRDVFIGLGMAHAGRKEEVVALDPVEHQSFQDTRLAIVVVQQALKGSLGERPVEEHAAIGTDDTQRDTVVDVFLTCLILYHAETVVGRAAHDNLIILAKPLDVSRLVIILHTDRRLQLRLLRLRRDDIVMLLFLIATGDKRGQRTKKHYPYKLLHYFWFNDSAAKIVFSE